MHDCHLSSLNNKRIASKHALKVGSLNKEQERIIESRNDFQFFDKKTRKMSFLKCCKASALFYSVIICHIGMCEHEKKCIEISEAEILNYGRRL